MCKSIDSSGDIPFLSTDLSSNMTQLPRYKLVLDITYLEVNGTYFKTKYMLTCSQNILLVDLTSQSYYSSSFLPKYFVCYSSTVSYIDTLSTHMVGLHKHYSFWRYHKMCILRIRVGIYLQLGVDHWLYLTRWCTVTIRLLECNMRIRKMVDNLA